MRYDKSNYTMSLLWLLTSYQTSMPPFVLLLQFFRRCACSPHYREILKIKHFRVYINYVTKPNRIHKIHMSASSLIKHIKATKWTCRHTQNKTNFIDSTVFAKQKLQYKKKHKSRPDFALLFLLLRRPDKCHVCFKCFGLSAFVSYNVPRSF